MYFQGQSEKYIWTIVTLVNVDENRPCRDAYNDFECFSNNGTRPYEVLMVEYGVKTCKKTF